MKNTLVSVGIVLVLLLKGAHTWRHRHKVTYGDSSLRDEGGLEVIALFPGRMVL
jgi:hypothetical protein